MSAIEPTITFEQYGTNVRVTQDWTSVLDKMARDIADRIDEATLARLGYVKQETCRNSAPSYLDFLCSECGFIHYHSDANDSGDGNDWRYCPNCGAKVVDE